MNTNNLGPKTILINLDLLFDFYSTLFSAYRTYFAKQSISINTYKHCIEGRNLDDGLKALVNEVSQGLDPQQVREELTPFLETSLKCIKPNIGVHTIVKDLTANGSIIKVFTNFEDYLVDFVTQTQKDWFKFEIIKTRDHQDMKNAMNYLSKQTTIMINSSAECCVAASKDSVPTVFVPCSKRTLEDLVKNEKLKENLNDAGVLIYETLGDIDWAKLGVLSTTKWPETSYYLQLDTLPKNGEYKVWDNISKLDKPIEVTSNIVHGFGRGGKKLGIPTANLDMTPEIEEDLINFVSGVYYGWAEFLPSSETQKSQGFEYNTKFPMVMSIGFNPYFNNKYKTAEAHIMKKFDQDFYESTLKVSVLGFIRTEADFMKFSHLIEAIHNDVQVAKDILNGSESL